MDRFSLVSQLYFLYKNNLLHKEVYFHFMDQICQEASPDKNIQELCAEIHKEFIVRQKQVLATYISSTSLHEASVATYDKELAVVETNDTIWTNYNIPRLQRKNLLAIGEEFAGGKIVKELGQGAMGTVYLMALQNQYYALKVAVPDHLPETGEDRFLREIKIGTEIKHPQIVRHYSMDYHSENFYFFLMEYVKGENLGKYVQMLKRPFEWQEAQSIVVDILDALEHLHHKNIIHRDLKPANILLYKSSPHTLRAKLADFGIAKSYENTGRSDLTKSRSTLGTLDYISPEQLNNPKEANHCSDLYSFAACLYFIFSGRKLFDAAKDIAALYHKIFIEMPPPLDKVNPKIPPSVAKIVMKGLAKEPQNRYQTAEEMKQDFMNRG